MHAISERERERERAALNREQQNNNIGLKDG